MPIHEQSYRRFEGRSLHRFRWYVIVEQEFMLLVKQRAFIILGLFGLLNFLFHLLIVVLHGLVMQDPEKYAVYAMIINRSEYTQVNAVLFYRFISWQIPIFFLTSLQAGSGMICNDFRNNLMELYFSKPISWIDYALGKSLTLIFIGLAYLAAPALFLIALHNMLIPGMDTLREGFSWSLSVTGYALVITLPTALGILAASALLRSQNYATIAVLMVLFVNSAMAVFLSESLRATNYKVLSIGLDIKRVGEHFFSIQNRAFDLRWEWSFGVIVGLCILASLVLAAKIRRAEVAS